jgi:hypothetical protein
MKQVEAFIIEQGAFQKTKTCKAPEEFNSIILNLVEVLFVKVHVFVLLLFATLPECSQNQTAVSDTLRLLSDF